MFNYLVKAFRLCFPCSPRERGTVEVETDLFLQHSVFLWLKFFGALIFSLRGREVDEQKFLFFLQIDTNF